MALGSLNDNAILKSQTYKPIGPECLQFWYYRDKNDGSTLNVLKYSNNVYSTPLWTKNDFSLGVWQYGQVQVGDTRSEFSFVFEVVKNKVNSNGVIGIDDVVLKIGTCQAPTNCNFEDATMCSWTQVNDDDLDWLLIQGQKGFSFWGKLNKIK